jgi:hypothetical protein
MFKALGQYLLIVSSAVLVFSLHGCVTLGSPSGKVVVRDGSTRVAISFNAHDRELIHRHYRKHKKRMPPGLAKKKRLPPGLQKQVKRKGHLPPGLQGRSLPHDLESKLSHLPDGYVRLRIGADLVIMNTKTRVFIDVLKDI